MTPSDSQGARLALQTPFDHRSVRLVRRHRDARSSELRVNVNSSKRTVRPLRDTKFRIILKNSLPIATIDDWFALAPPKDGLSQWVDGRSAKESAKAWLNAKGGMPLEIAALLSFRADIGPLTVERVEPECLLAFDDHRGPRNADIAIWAQDANGPLAITVEAKADEPYDRLVADVFDASMETLLEKVNSKALTRVADLSRCLFGARRGEQAHVMALRYQLMTATAGTLALARSMNATRGVVIVHEIISASCMQAKLDVNAHDWKRFLNRISGGTVTDVQDGVLYGPFTVPGAPLFDEPATLYFGKAVRRLPRDAAR